MFFIGFQGNRVILVILVLFSTPLRLRPRKQPGSGGGLAGGHSQEVLHAPPQLRVLRHLPQAPVELLHLPVFTADI